VLVPLRPGEALWIAISLTADIYVTAAAANGSEVRLSTLSTASYETLLAADALITAGEPRAIDDHEIVLAATHAGSAEDHLRLRFITKAGHSAGELGVVLGTPALYESLSGLMAPQETTPDDAYRGWHLP
jgi:hypothetical protein